MQKIKVKLMYGHPEIKIDGLNDKAQVIKK
jgi:hypothetical protein